MSGNTFWTALLVGWVSWFFGICSEPTKPVPTVYEYLFNNSFRESGGKSPALVAIGAGRFNTQLICSAPRGVYSFDWNCGFMFDNAAALSFIGAGHSIELYFRFDKLGSWKRIVDYKNRNSDTGPYAFDNQIEFYQVAKSETFPFVENQWMHVVLTRNQTTQEYILYVNGRRQASFIDKNGLGTVNTSNVLRFFQDDLVKNDEASSGTIALLRLYNYTVPAEKVAVLFAGENLTQPCPFSKKPLVIQDVKPKEYSTIDKVEEKIKKKETVVGNKIIIENIQFSPNSSSLETTSFRILEKVTAFMKKHPTVTIRILGHTDKVPNFNEEYCQKLSLERAKTVRDYLLRQGLGETRVDFKGLGTSKPLTAGTDESSRQKNRRTEFEILGQ